MSLSVVGAGGRRRETCGHTVGEGTDLNSSSLMVSYVSSFFFGFLSNSVWCLWIRILYKNNEMNVLRYNEM